VKHGVVAGYSISFKAITSRSKGAIALTAREGLDQVESDAIWDEHGNDIILMNKSHEVRNPILFLF
jgi:LuxR family transcriptional regulator